MKPCFKCGEIKPLDEFYKHPQMADGRLNKCKDCTKVDVSNRIELLKDDPYWMAKERERCRLKIHRYRADGREKKTRYRPAVIIENKARELARSKAAYAQRIGVLKKPERCSDCDIPTSRLQKHHDDYGRPLDVKWLCLKCHGITHRLPFGTPVQEKAFS